MNIIDRCNSIDEVVNLINDEFATCYTAEELAAMYAKDEDVDSVEYHLDMLVENGAKFDYRQAEKLARDLKE